MILFDIIIPTYNRPEAVKKFVLEIGKLSGNEFKVWIVDDFGSASLELIIPQDNPRFELFKLDKNLGQAGARNTAISKGKAPYIISLDDDSWFDEIDGVFEKIEETFFRYHEAGCLMFNVATPLTYYNNLADGLELPLHVTCGCVYRREALERIGGFNAILQGQAEETDISLKLIKSGYTIRSLYSVKVFHDFNPNNRSLDWYLRIRFKNTRNDLAIIFIHYPIFKAIYHIPLKALSHLKFAFSNRISVFKTAFVTIKAWGEFITWLPELKRSPMSNPKFKYWNKLRNAAKINS